MIHLHHDDLPPGLDLGPVVAVDSEAMGLLHHRDRLCLVQLSSGDGDVHLVKLANLAPAEMAARAPNLRALLEDPERLKLLHFARFDLAAFRHWLDARARPVFCTKIASRLVRTFTDRHGLRDICRELLGVEISKEQQSSDWGAETLTEAQQGYAASDVLHLHALKDKLDAMLAREGRLEAAAACFDFLPTRAELDLAAGEGFDIFAHS